MNERLGFILLAVWLILMGLSQLLSLSFIGFSVVLGLLALAAGILLLLREFRVRRRR